MLLMVVALFAIFGLTLGAFLNVDNLMSLVWSVSSLGIFGVAMTVVVIARGMTLSLIASMGVATAVAIQLMCIPVSTPVALMVGLGIVLIIGLFSGFLIAFVEIPALFATMASGLLVYGLARNTVFDGSIAELPGNCQFVLSVGQSTLFGTPVPIVVFARSRFWCSRCCHASRQTSGLTTSAGDGGKPSLRRRAAGLRPATGRDALDHR
ncbi:ABC transporter permease [Candidatus Protofrankia californiensis]|uniref:ABC transporter permease n=1 Tax=Candidatus Protofrankia californiensis TaxID=1839754 RepID=UPI0019D28EAB|nr:ABC transporter permease [Candidatus Protofrankia californiensis]